MKMLNSSTSGQSIVTTLKRTYFAVPNGGIFSLGCDNGRGGISTFQFTKAAAEHLMETPEVKALDAYIRASGSPHKYNILFKDYLAYEQGHGHSHAEERLQNQNRRERFASNFPVHQHVSP